MAEQQDPTAIDDENDAFTMRSLTRMVAWGTGAAAALFLAVLASLSEPGESRVKLAVANITGVGGVPVTVPQQQVSEPQKQPSSGPSEAEQRARQLSEQVRRLTADREKLAERVSALERNLEDITGSIRRYEERVPAAAASVPPTAERLPQAAQPSDHGEETTASTTATAWPAPAAPAVPVEPGPWPATTTAVIWPGARQQGASAAAATTPTPLPRPEHPAETATKPDIADETAAKPGPASPEPRKPEPTQKMASQAAKLEPAAMHGAYGVDLGGAVSVSRLKMLWNTVRSKEARLLRGLRPVTKARRPKHGGRPDVRLVAGPLRSAEDANRLCSALLNAGRFCEPTRFEGHRLR